MEKEKLYEITKRIIGNTIKKVMRNNPKLVDQEDIRVQAQALLIKQLTDKVDISSDFSDEKEKTIEYVMRVFNRAFAEEYKQYIPEEQIKEQEDLGEER